MSAKINNDLIKIPKLTNTGRLLHHIEELPVVKTEASTSASAPTMTAGLDPAAKTSTANDASTAMSMADQQWVLGEAMVKQHIASFMPDSIFNRIKNRGTLLSMEMTLLDDGYTSIILSTLPDSYNLLVSTMTATVAVQNDTLSSDTVIRLDGKDAAFTAASSGGLGGRNEGKKNLQCYNCRRKGHMKAECWVKGGVKEGQRPSSKGKGDSANAAAADGDDEGMWPVVTGNPLDFADVSSFWTDADDAILMADDGRHTATGVESDLYNSGASQHMSPFCHHFFDFENINPRPIAAADNQESTAITLKDVLCCRIGQVFAITNCLYRVDHGEVVAAASEKTVHLMLEQVHRQLGHIALDTAKQLVQDGTITSIQIVEGMSITSCNSCEYAKMTRKEIHKERSQPQAENFSGHHYFHLAIDEATRWTWTKLIHTKDESFQAYKEVHAWIKTQHGVKIKCCHSDRGGEFISTDFMNYLTSRGTERRLTTYNTLQHNGIAESANCCLFECIHAMQHQSSLSKAL
ncbi:hypothetical protein NM688_g58 [Phlebia brevispora]|uniref:Uncharacterized protein n=1 Tax=Phlebia brevispora TaxID=194682 RepID=A0ACC1TFN5_9APHY|nr:hypothetical protein NM688_g58 [Phlebia brevispora]